MRTEVYAKLGEIAGFFTDDNINQWLNDGLDEVCIRLEPILASATLDTTAATTEYLLPSDLISLHQVLYKDASDHWQQLRETTYEDLFRTLPTWEEDTTTGVPTHFYWRQESVGLYPQPTTGDSDILRIIYTCRAAEFASDNATSGLPNYLDRCIVMYAVMRGRSKDRDEQRMAVAKAEFEEAIAHAAGIINKQRKEAAPRLYPKQRNYRQFYAARFPRTQAWSE